MRWIYLFIGTVLAVISLYYIFTHKQRNAFQDYVIYTPENDDKKIGTGTKLYKAALYLSYVVLILALVLYVEVFRSFETSTIIFILMLLTGGAVLLTLEKLFEIRGQGIVFAGYQANWGKIRQIGWGKKRRRRTQLIMELDKGTKIKTTIANEEKDQLEELLENYVTFDKEQTKK
ncbi:hypothetical protein [Alteribacter natronophilus]|uniref:hypothetical protein n=1 Tax=Alteribacter natronophilus TaxID=2583810 RepID=UPI00110F1B28|nr:hypothetical protein [Alteribacter natronophilus]TMW71523.1 hypothetical protein FGB90_10815 [Alteribacter natronophilus]